MVRTVSLPLLNPSNGLILVGKQLLEIVAAGMYSNPLMIFREYVQNSADSIDHALALELVSTQEAQIAITLKGDERSISVEYNGVCVPADEVHRTLLSLGASLKNPNTSRGFRGIGRLGGLGYCDKLIFQTRSCALEPITTVIWDSVKIAELLKQDEIVDIQEVIKQAVEVTQRYDDLNDTPSHFFRVKMINVHRFHRDWLMDVKKIRAYLMQIAPVPYEISHFSFADKITQHLSALSNYRCYDIILNGEKILRPYRNTVVISTNLTDEIKDVELIDFRNSEESIMGIGWYANTDYIASLPTNNLMRGIRLRQGNIEIGDEFFLAEYFSERRFSTWHIGEIHLSSDFIPNARRDGFEPTAGYERFLEYATLLGKHLSRLCRESSSKRSFGFSIERRFKDIEDRIANSIIFDKEHHQVLCGQIKSELCSIENTIKLMSLQDGILSKFEILKIDFVKFSKNPQYLVDCLDGRSLRYRSGKDLICEFFKILLEKQLNGKSIEQNLNVILAPYLKPTKKKN